MNMDLLRIATPVHGRVAFEPRGRNRLLIGFHGYAETADANLAEIERIPGIRDWSVAAVQALHPFYSRGGTVIGASWMTSLDRDLAIDDNLNYIRNVLNALPKPTTLVFLGFSQGAAMAARAAAHIDAAGLILLGGDLPADVRNQELPPTLLARGSRDEWYTEEKFKDDLKYFTPARTVVFQGGHEWTDEFCVAAGEFLDGLKGSESA
jgi:predicted esterase